MSDLADRVALLPAFVQESGGESYGPCPLACGSVVYVQPEGAVWCGGGCPAKDVTTALLHALRRWYGPGPEPSPMPGGPEDP